MIDHNGDLIHEFVTHNNGDLIHKFAYTAEGAIDPLDLLDVRNCGVTLAGTPVVAVGGGLADWLLEKEDAFRDLLSELADRAIDTAEPGEPTCAVYEAKYAAAPEPKVRFERIGSGLVAYFPSER